MRIINFRLPVICVFVVILIFQSCKEKVKNPQFVPDDIHQKQIRSLLHYGKSTEIQKEPSLFVEFVDSSSLFLSQTKGNFEIRKSLIYYLAEELEAVGLVDESIIIFTNSLNDNTARIQDDSIYNNRSLFGNLSRLHKKAGNIDSVFYYEHLSLNVTKNHVNPYEIASPLNNIGYHHLENGNLDSASYYFDSVTILLEKYPPNSQYWDFFRCSLDDNIATIHELNDEFENTIPLYKKNYLWYWRKKHSFRRHNAGISLANAYIETDKYDSAFPILEKVLAELNEKAYSKNYINSVYLNQVYSKLFLNKGDISLSNQYAKDAAVMERDIIAKEKEVEYQYNKKLKLYAKERNNQIVVLQRLQNSELDKKNTLRLLVLIFIIVIIGLVFWVYYSKARSNQRKFKLKAKIADQEVRQERNEKKLLDIELEFKKKDLIGVLLNMKQKDSWARDLNEQMKTVKEAVGHKRRNELNKLHNQIRSHLQANKDRELQTNNLDLLDAEFHNKILKAFPLLTKSEQQLFSLIKINITSHQIAEIKNVEYNSIKTLRHRLKLKLGLKPSDSLDSFILQF